VDYPEPSLLGTFSPIIEDAELLYGSEFNTRH